MGLVETSVAQPARFRSAPDSRCKRGIWRTNLNCKNPPNQAQSTRVILFTQNLCNIADPRHANVLWLKFIFSQLVLTFNLGRPGAGEPPSD